MDTIKSDPRYIIAQEIYDDIEAALMGHPADAIELALLRHTCDFYLNCAVFEATGTNKSEAEIFNSKVDSTAKLMKKIYADNLKIIESEKK